MAYGFHTSKYLLPAPIAGDTIDSTEEIRLANTIENNVFGGIVAHSGGHGIINVGTVITSFESGTGIIRVVENKPIPAIQGFINQKYFGSNNGFAWEVGPTTTSFLYVQAIESEPFSTTVNGSFLVDQNTTGVIPDDAVLVFIANTTSSGLSLDTDPPGRINIQTVAQHAADNTDPHTSLLLQTQMITSGLDVRGLTDTEDLLVRHNLTVSGITTLNSAIVSGLIVQNDLNCEGSATFTGQVTFLDGLIFTNATFGHINITSGLIVSGTSTLIGSADLQSGGVLSGVLQVASGVTVDGVDISTLRFLIDGSNADWGPTTPGHYHVLSGVSPKFIGFSPEYQGSVISGLGIGTLSTEQTSEHNLYRWKAQDTNNQTVSLFLRMGVPSDFSSFVTESGIKLFNQIDSLISGSSINISMKDTLGTTIGLNPSSFQNTTLTESQISFSGISGVFERGRFFTTRLDLSTYSGIDCLLGEMTLQYNPLLLRTGP